MNDFVVVGLNHKSAPVAVREKCAVADADEALRDLGDLAEEACLLTTCNRFEVYAHAVDDPAALVAWIAARAGVTPDELAPHCYVRAGKNACKHLFFVAAALDSLVVGETQIRNQVKEAYRLASERGAVGAALHALFQAALRVSKEIADKTGVGRGTVSVAGAAADLAERVFADLAGAAVLVIGAGETAELVLTHLQSRGVTRIAVANRDPEHARAVAAKFDATAGGLEGLPDALAAADVVVAAAGGPEPIVSADAVRAALRRRRGRPIVAIDIAVPRAIDPATDDLDNLYRYDMAALEVVTEDGLRHRRKEFLQCCTLIDAATLRLAEETRGRARGDVIAALEDGFREIAEREIAALERRLPALDDEGRNAVRRAVHRIVRKLLHRPVRALRHGSAEESEVIRRAFATREDDQ